MEYLCPNGVTIEIHEAKGNTYYEMQIDTSGSFTPESGVLVKIKTRSAKKTIDKLLAAGVTPSHIRIDGIPCRIRKFYGRGPMQYNLGMFLYRDDRFPNKHQATDIPYVTDIIE